MLKNTSGKKHVRVGIVGFGPFCKHTYLKYIEENKVQYGIEIDFIVDLEKDFEKVTSYCLSNNLKVKKCISLPNSERHSNAFTITTKKKLDELLNACDVDIVIISTEPKSHFKYLKYFIGKNIHVMVDKPPVCGFDENTNKISGVKMIREAVYIGKLLKQHNVKCVVLAQRRMHEGFLKVKEILKDVNSKFRLPINYIGAFHSDGMWNMPNELIERENHPYKYGYGKIIHSGYHFVDMMFWLQDINKEVEAYSMSVAKFDCRDFVENMNSSHYEQFFNLPERKDLFQKPDFYRGFGELDSYSIFQFKRKSGTVVCTSTINALQNSFSRRAWSVLPEDTYKSNGRLRHESWNIQIAPVLNIQIHSYESYEKNNGLEKHNFTIGSVGHENHFDINIFRNASLIGGKPFEQIRLGAERKDLMTNSRMKSIDQLFAFVYSDTRSKLILESEFVDHFNTIRAVGNIYKLYYNNKHATENIPYSQK